MASLDHAANRRVYFGNLWKRARTIEGSSLLSADCAKVSSDQSNFDAATECSATQQHGRGTTAPISNRRSGKSRLGTDTSPMSESDSESCRERSRRASSLLSCFRSCIQLERRSKSSKILEVEGNLGPTDPSLGQGDGMAVPRLRSHIASFYSVASHWDPSIMGHDSNESFAKTFWSASRCNNDSWTSPQNDDYFSLDGDCEGETPSTCRSLAVDFTNKSKPGATKKEDCLTTTFSETATAPCCCNFSGHASTFDPEMPLIVAPGVTPGSYEDHLIIAKSCVGYWVTILERSESLDPQYRLLGLGMIKRAVMNRLAVPLTMFLEEDDTILHCWIHTPLGIRHMRSSLLGKEIQDTDPDAGDWVGITKIVDYCIPWFCNGKPVRAIQQTRHNAKIGTCRETRCILPDSDERKIMFFNFTMIPKGKTEADKLSADRLLKYVKEENT